MKLPGGVLFINADGSRAEGNPSFLKIHGWDLKKPIEISASLLELYHVYDLNFNKLSFDKWPIVKLLNRQEFEDEKYILEIINTGKRFYASYSGYPQFDESGVYQGGIFFMNDMTELADAKTRLEEVVGEKNKYYREMEKYQQQLKDDRELLQTIIDTIPVMITIYEKKFESIVLNNAFVEIAGWTNEDAKKTSIMELAYPDPEYRAEIYDYVQSLNPGFKDILLRTKDGRCIETSWANVEIPDGRQVGVGLDISERKRLENELISAREKAENASRVQLAFIQSISHEVRTPMNSILGYTELLYKHVKEQPLIDFLDAISYNGRQLLRLIDDIIDISRLDNKELKVQKEELNLQMLLTQLENQIPSLQKYYNKTHLKIQFQKSGNENEELMMHSDGIRLQQVLTNLISNAIQYTKQGIVEVGYKLRKESGDIIFYVKDTGIGIDKEKHDKVFKRFSRLHDTTKKEARGTGLGLAITKQLVELLDGKIWFESEPGKGSVFYFSHPWNKDVQYKKESTKLNIENVAIPDLKGKTILIVEDDAFSYMMMYHMLLETNATILHTDSGIKTIEMISENNVDFVFLDIRLPGTDGYKVLEQIRKTKEDLPVVAQTANALPEDKQKIKLAGFNNYITKPISQENLYIALNKHFSISSPSEESRSQLVVTEEDG